jgi:hypothetical protein
MTNTTWQYAIDPSTLAFHTSALVGGKLPSPVFDTGKPPVMVTALACPVAWDLAGDTFATSPPKNPACVGATRNITLWPYGVSHTAFMRHTEY